MKKLQVFGTGCPKCKKLAEHAETAAKQLGLACEVEKVTDIVKIVDFGVMVPALVVDGEVKVSGSVPSIEEIKSMLV